MGAAIFVTGTDTSVGKTVVGMAIVCALRSGGLDVGVMKPVECGTSEGLSDRELLTRAADNGGRDSPEDICPYRFEQPLAPAVAATLAGVSIDPGAIVAAFLRLKSHHDVLIVEGAGGLLVPIGPNYLMADLVADLGGANDGVREPGAKRKSTLPLLVVAHQRLGSINHCLLTIEAARSHSLEICGVIFNGYDPERAGIAERTNPDVIAQTSGVPILGILPQLPGLRDANDPVEHVRQHTAGVLDLATLRSVIS